MSEPTEPGWYWIRLLPDREWQAGCLQRSNLDGRPFVEIVGVSRLLFLDAMPDRFDWGPRIAPPRNPEED